MASNGIFLQQLNSSVQARSAPEILSSAFQFPEMIYDSSLGLGLCIPPPFLPATRPQVPTKFRKPPPISPTTQCKFQIYAQKLSKFLRHGCECQGDSVNYRSLTCFCCSNLPNQPCCGLGWTDKLHA